MPTAANQERDQLRGSSWSRWLHHETVLAIQVYRPGTVDDLSPGDRVLVVLSSAAEAGEPVVAMSVIVNAPTGGGVFRGGGFGTGGFVGKPQDR